MKPGKIVSLDDYRAERRSRGDKIRNVDSGISLPSADRLWELLDRNISITVWRERNCA
jgi:hypothetical protein